MIGTEDTRLGQLRAFVELPAVTRGPAAARAAIAAVLPVWGLAALTDDEPSGRGMAIVQAVASAWAVEDHPGGKRVWVELQSEPDGVPTR